MLVVNELAAPVIRPLVVRTYEPVDHAAARIAQPRPAVAADIVKGAQRHVAVAHDDDRAEPDLDREELPGLRDLRLDTHEDPIAPKNPRDIRVEDFGT